MTKQLIDDIYALIPYEERRGKHGKRALLPFLGDALHSLFGVARDSDYDAMQVHMKQIAETVNQELKVMKKSSTDFSSFAVTSTKRLDALVAQVNNNSIESIRLVEGAISDIDARFKYLNLLMLHTMELEHSFSELERYLLGYLAGTEMLIAGYLPVYLVTREILQETLRSVESSLAESGQLYHLVHTNVQWYFRRASFIYKRDETTLFITLQIPLTSFATKFDVFQVKTFAIPTHETNSSHATQINNLPDGFSIDISGQFYYLLTEAELKDLDSREHSNILRVYNLAEQKSCILAIYRDNTEDIKQWCSFSILMHSLVSGITHIKDSTFLLTKVMEYTMTCGRETKVVEGCTLCLIELKSNCSISSGNQFIPPEMAEHGNSAEFKKKHVTNLGMLLHFFDLNTTLRSISGKTLLAEPAEVNLPSLRFFEHEVSEKFAADRKLKVDLERAAEAVREDGVIMNNVGEAVVLGEIPLQNNYWISMPGFVSLASSGLILLLILNVCYLLFRVRKLAIVVMVLQNHALKTKAQQAMVFNYYNTGSLPSANNLTAVSSAPLHTIIVDTTAQIWPYLLATLVGLALVIGMAYKIWKHTCKKPELNTKFHVMLEFASNQRSVFVGVLKLFGQPNDYRATAEDFIKEIRVEGCICPKLKFTWNTLCLTDTITGEVFRIKTTHSLTWAQAWAVKSKLRRPFVVLPVFVRDNQMTRIDVINTSAPPCPGTGRGMEEVSGGNSQFV